MTARSLTSSATTSRPLAQPLAPGPFAPRTRLFAGARGIVRAALLGAFALAGVAASGSAAAGELKICVVDADQALAETKEGKAAKAKLEGMFTAKRAELAKAEEDFAKAVEDYRSRAPILSEAARAETEKKLAEQQAAGQQAAMTAEMEMQQTYEELLAGIQEKLIAVSEDVAKTKACTVLLQRAAALYVSSDVVDVTGDVIKAYDAK